MRAARLFLLAFFLLPLSAQAATHSSPFIDQMVGYYNRIAAAFGCSDMANSDYDSQLAILEFLPANQNFNGWTRMFTANILPLPQNEAEVAGRMVAFRQNLLDTIGKSGTVVDVRDLKNARGLPVTYIEYVAGEGAVREHAAGVFARHSSTLAAFTQVQVRQVDLSATDKANMQQLAVNMAKR